MVYRSLNYGVYSFPYMIVFFVTRCNFPKTKVRAFQPINSRFVDRMFLWRE